MFAKRSLLLLSGLTITLMLSGCLGSVQKPEVHLIGLTYANIGKDRQTIGVELQVRNPNYFAISIQTGNVVILVNGSTFATGSIPEPVVLPADSTSDVTIPIETTTAALKSVIPVAIMSGGLAYSVRGDVVADGHNFPLSYSGNLTTKQVEGML